MRTVELNLLRHFVVVYSTQLIIIIILEIFSVASGSGVRVAKMVNR